MIIEISDNGYTMMDVLGASELYTSIEIKWLFLYYEKI